MLDKIGALISGPSGLLILIFFFLPWVNLSCSMPLMGESTLVDASGYDLATGNAYKEAEKNLTGGTLDSSLGADSGMITLSDDIDSEDSFNTLKAHASVWLVALAGLFVIVIAVLHFAQVVPPMAAGVGYTFAGIFGLAALTLKYMGLEELADDVAKANEEIATQSAADGTFEAGFTLADPLDFSYQFAFYGTTFFLVILIITGLMVIFLAPQAATPTTQPDLESLTAAPSGYGSGKPPSWTSDIQE